MGPPTGECLQRGYPVKEVLEVAEFAVNKLDCLRGLELVSPQAQRQWWYLGHPHPVAWQWPALHSCSRGEL